MGSIEGDERRPQRQPEAIASLLQRREAYLGKIRDFIQDAPFGSPRLLAVDDLAASYLVQNQTKADRAAYKETVRTRRTMIQGYQKAKDELRNLGENGDLDEEMTDTELLIYCHKTNPNLSQKELLFNMNMEVGSGLLNLVDARIDELDKNSDAIS